jgi:hypothetical protein
MESVLQNKLTGLYFDGIAFETGLRHRAKRIDGALSHDAVRMIWGNEVRVIEVYQSANTSYTFQHESGNGTFIVRASDIGKARELLATAIGSDYNAHTYWEHMKSEVIK